jgi:hypothetical protein
MTHNGLVNEVTLQLTPRFLPDPRGIKERIEALIEVRDVTRYSRRKTASCSVFRESILGDVKMVNHTTMSHQEFGKIRMRQCGTRNPEPDRCEIVPPYDPLRVVMIWLQVYTILTAQYNLVCDSCRIVIPIAGCTIIICPCEFYVRLYSLPEVL